MTQGTSPIIGYNYGARNKKRMYSALRIAIIIAFLILSVGFLVFQIAPEWILSLFASGDTAANALMLEVGVPELRIISLSFFFAAFGIMFSALFQAVGKGVYSMILSFLRQLVVLIPSAFLLSKIDLGVIWYAFPIAEIVALLCALVFFFRLRSREFKMLDRPLEQ